MARERPTLENFLVGLDGLLASDDAKASAPRGIVPRPVPSRARIFPHGVFGRRAGFPPH